MINSKGETIYTNAEIAYELGLTAATINAVGKRVFGYRAPHWTLSDAKTIVEYIKSITVEEDAKRLALLHETVQQVMGGEAKLNDDEMRERVDKDIHG